MATPDITTIIDSTANCHPVHTTISRIYLFLFIKYENASSCFYLPLQSSVWKGRGYDMDMEKSLFDEYAPADMTEKAPIYGTSL